MYFALDLDRPENDTASGGDVTRRNPWKAFIRTLLQKGNAFTEIIICRILAK